MSRLMFGVSIILAAQRERILTASPFRAPAPAFLQRRKNREHQAGTVRRRGQRTVADDSERSRRANAGALRGIVDRFAAVEPAHPVALVAATAQDVDDHAAARLLAAGG